MILLSASNINKSYGVDTILENVSFHVNKGDRIGIVGENGAGKTTLMNILAGELSRDDGEIYMPKDTAVGYLKQKNNFSSDKTVYEEMLSIFSHIIEMEQEISSMTAEIEKQSKQGIPSKKLLEQYDELMLRFQQTNGYSYRGEINGILSSMAFPEEFFDKKISILSGGEQTRLALAALLLKKPDLLLLDEPTNHLDIGTLNWLEQYLKSYGGTVVLISHDRYFLDQTVNRIFEVRKRKVTVYEGNYSTYTEKKRLLTEDAMRRYTNQQAEIRRQEDIIRKFKERGTEKLAKRAQSREKRLARVEVVERPDTSTGKMRIHFKERYKSGTDVLLGEDLSMSFENEEGVRQLFQHVTLDLKRGERVCLVGENGIGKTTLLKMILGELAPDTGVIRKGHNVSIGYFDQQQEGLNNGNTVLEELHGRYRLYTETELRSFLGRFLFSGDTVFKMVGDLSGGEKARLALLKLMLSGDNLLLLDEPTNHLDIAAKEVFEDSLLDFPGTLLMVSHDRYFLNKIPTRILELTDGGMLEYLGTYDYYVEKKDTLKNSKEYLSQLGKKAAHPSSSADEEEALNEKEQRMLQRKLEKEQQKEERKRQKQLSQSEEQIAALEEEIAEIEQKMCSPEALADYEQLNALSAKLNDRKKALEDIYAQWLILSE